MTVTMRLTCLSAAVLATAAPAAPDTLVVSENSATIPPYEVFELTLTRPQSYANPFREVVCAARFTSPDGDVSEVGGFLYGAGAVPAGASAPYAQAAQSPGEATLWKVRFAPDRAGVWRYSYVFEDKAGFRSAGDGTFRCVPHRGALRQGFVRRNPENPFGWVFDDGTPYFPIGLQDMLGIPQGLNTVLSAMALEGPFRAERTGPALPPGPLFQPGPSMSPVSADVYFRRYARCGFNLFRHPGHNAPSFGAPDLPDLHNCAATDELLLCVRKYGYRTMFCLFGWDGAWKMKPDDAEGMEKTKRFAKYIVDRWGAYVDFWEFYNEESNVPPGWYEIMTPYLKSIDPYRHPVTTSYPRPAVTNLDFESPHHYSSPDAPQADFSMARLALDWKKPGKPVIVGEFGNSADRDRAKRKPGVGGVWDPDSATRLRIRNWTALFSEVSLAFWNTSYARDGHFMNIWLGPREREYVRAMQSFAARLDAGVSAAIAGVSELRQARAYGLFSPRCSAAYVHHFADHAQPLDDLYVAVQIPRAAGKLNGCWYDPASGAIVSRFDPADGEPCEDDALPDYVVFAAPAFTVDIALLITPDAPPDSDGDGLPNDEDPDYDNDGVPNDKDAFPLEPEEWADADGDLIGDNLDADWDPADGIGDDRNGNGIPDHEEMDLDGDGVPRANAVPWDAFPSDPGEWSDLDGDGIGDNSDPDMDGDGWTNEEEKKAGADPRSPLHFPTPE